MTRISTRRRLYLVVAFFVSMTIATTQAADAAACDTTWRVQSAAAFPSGAELNDVAVTGTGETWVVGDVAGQGLIGHFVNGSWSTARYAVSGESVLLRSVDAQPGAAWAIGSVSNASSSRPLLLVNTGSGWHSQALPRSAANVFPTSVVIRHPDDVWIAGLVSHFPNPDQPAALHWNGSQLTATTLQFKGFPLGIEAPDQGSVVMVGESEAAFPLPPQAWRWNGYAWTADRMPPVPFGEESALSNVDGTPTNMWALGFGGGGCCSAFPFVYHWTGSQWTENTPSTGGSSLNDLLLSRADGHVVVIGQSPCDDACANIRQAEVWEWSGSAWTKIQLTGLNPGVTSGLGAIDGDGKGGRWAVGAQNGHPLLLRQCVPMA